MRNSRIVRLGRIMGAGLAMVVILASCTGGDASDESGLASESNGGVSDVRAVARAEHVGIDEADVVFVAAEGQWLCDVQSRAFTNLEDLETARTVMLSNFGIDDAAYAAFKSRLGDDAILRDHVLTEFEAVCTG